MLANGDELNLILPKLTRSFQLFLTRQAFCHFNKQISLEERSQNFPGFVCNFPPPPKTLIVYMPV